MPQNKPMTPEAVIQSIDDNYAPLSIDAKISIDDLLDQLVRSTLESAAERFCKICPGPGCPGECKVSSKSECGYWRTIREPLPSPDEIECATLDEVNHRRGSGA